MIALLHQIKINKFIFGILLLISSASFSQTNEAWDNEYWGKNGSYLAKGDEMFKNKRFFEAIQFLNKSIEINNKNFWAYYLRGTSKSMLEDNRGALIDLVTAEDILNLDKSYNLKGASNYNLFLRNIYASRGATYIKLSNKNEGCLWLSKAGELGDEKSYSLIQKFCR